MKFNVLFFEFDTIEDGHHSNFSQQKKMTCLQRILSTESMMCHHQLKTLTTLSFTFKIEVVINLQILSHVLSLWCKTTIHKNQLNHVKKFFSPTRIYYSAMLKARISCFQNHDSQVFFFEYDLYIKRWEENIHVFGSTATTTKVMIFCI